MRIMADPVRIVSSGATLAVVMGILWTWTLGVDARQAAETPAAAATLAPEDAREAAAAAARRFVDGMRAPAAPSAPQPDAPANRPEIAVPAPPETTPPPAPAAPPDGEGLDGPLGPENAEAASPEAGAAAVEADPEPALETARVAAPAPRPDPLAAESVAVLPAGLCGDARLEGEAIPPISERLASAEPSSAPACVVAEPVRLDAIAGVAISPPVVLGCPMARRVADWLVGAAGTAAEGVAPGDPIVRIEHVSGYSCRRRAGGPRAKLSEHASANAFDIAAFRLKSGRIVTVLDGWADPEDGPLLRALSASACGPFATVLTPETDAAHADHLHVDGAQRRAPYCP